MQASDKKHRKELKRKKKRLEIRKHKAILDRAKQPIVSPKKAIAHSVAKSVEPIKAEFDKNAWVKTIASPPEPPTPPGIEMIREGDEAPKNA